MAATGRTLSPGGALLRASRMFSLPSALPPPPADHQSASSNFSDTATQRFPTLQTVTAPEQFRQRGDWGFKRHFPLRSTAKTSTPYLRIKQVDSMEQVTDFASASGHTLSLEKFREMNIAISLPHPTTGANESIKDMRLRSVFEDQFDFTALNVEKIAAAGHRRWKYKGPWLANLTHGEFQSFLKKQVRGRREEFRQVIREHLAEKQTEEATNQAVAAGTSEETQAAVRPEDVTDEQITHFYRIARINNDELNGLVSKFLDLAPIDHEGMDYLQALAPEQSKRLNPSDPYAKYGPPVTHPSAGLSYLRTKSFLENHPVYGPQRLEAPIKARLMGISEKIPSKAAVGGFVGYSGGYMGRQAIMDWKLPGGAKTWVHVASAQVDSTGRAILTFRQAPTEEKLIVEEALGEKQVFRAKPPEEEPMDLPIKQVKPSVRRDYRKFSSPLKFSSSDSYGTGATYARR